ncbi:MAG TPA: exosortase/archaeosortase family protein [Candidatus Hydrogenedentes bacterium]|jgi:exosortase|nr:exosortase/archaeosortase family protein [Candidatus Hydrogenedentota bacterium]HPJ98380.1 exosortase/archaeosortase family protein [Candidatus Hydrogenedentota bacterium]
MMQESQTPAAPVQAPAAGTEPLSFRSLFELKDLVVVALLAATYRNVAHELRAGWTLVDSYYSHGFLIPFISLFFVWRERKSLASLPRNPSAWGYPWLAAAATMLFVGDFLGFGVLTHMSLLPMITGVLLLTHGVDRTRTIWFPIAFLFFMIPIPASITQSLALRLKLIATESAVQLANLFTLPMVREGSYVHFGDDFLLVGEVCGGLRSMIALLALGALMAYISKTRWLARMFLFLIAAPLVAILTNILRIFSLCVVGYFYGSTVAAGTFHDVSGILIFLTAFICFFTLEGLLRKTLPARENRGTAS